MPTTEERSQRRQQLLDALFDVLAGDPADTIEDIRERMEEKLGRPVEYHTVRACIDYLRRNFATTEWMIPHSKRGKFGMHDAPGRFFIVMINPRDGTYTIDRLGRFHIYAAAKSSMAAIATEAAFACIVNRIAAGCEQNPQTKKILKRNETTFQHVAETFHERLEQLGITEPKFTGTGRTHL